MQSNARTVDEYLAELPDERREPMRAVLALVRKNLPEGFVESMQYGMIAWGIPLARYPETYNGQPLGIAALASQKQYMALYLMGVYGDPALEKWFREAWGRTGKKLDMGKSCLRFKKVDDLALDVLAETIARVTPEQLIARYEEVRGISGSKPSARAVRNTAATTAKKAVAKKAVAKKAVAKKEVAKKR